MENNASMLVSVVIMAAVLVALVVDMVRARRARARRAARLRPGTPVVRERAAELPSIPMAATATPPPAPAIHTWTVARPLPPAEVDPIRELAERLAALRSLGLDYVKSAHPLFRAAAMASAAAPKPASVPAFVLAPPAAPVRRRRPRRASYGAPRATTALRLVVDRGA